MFEDREDPGQGDEQTRGHAAMSRSSILDEIEEYKGNPRWIMDEDAIKCRILIEGLCNLLSTNIIVSQQRGGG
jgi:hypothetical protein